MQRRLSHIFAPALAVLVIASALTACDTAGTTEAESDFAYFAGTWTVASVTAGSAQFDSGNLTFRFFEEGGRERFSISGETAGGQAVDIEGRVAFGIGNEFQLVSDDFAGETDFVEVRYDIDNSTRVKLLPAEHGAALVRALLNQDLADVTITLVRT